MSDDKPKHRAVIEPKALDRKARLHDSVRTNIPVPIVHNNYDKLRTGIVKTLLLVMQHRRDSAHDAIDCLLNELETDKERKLLPAESVFGKVLEELDEVFGKINLKKITVLHVETDD